MGLILKEDLKEHGVLGIWETTEENDFFENQIHFFPEEIEELSLLKTRKKREWLSSRYLLHVLSEREIRGACMKDSYGKPYLKDAHFHISISHSDDYTAVIGSPYSCGIDIQKWVPKIDRLAQRFISAKEWAYIPKIDALSYYHVLWGAKEALYKSYGKKALDFRSDMEIDPFVFNPDGFFFEGKIQKADLVQNYSLFCRQIDQMILVYAIQKA